MDEDMDVYEHGLPCGDDDGSRFDHHFPIALQAFERIAEVSFQAR